MLKKTDIELVRLLRQDGRMRAKEMCTNLKLPLSTVYEKLTNTGNLIRRFTCLLNHEAWGNSLHAIVIFKVAAKDRFPLQQELESCNNVNLLWRINNGSDFIAEFIFPNLFAFEAYKESIESRFGVKTATVHFMVDEIKRETFVPG